MRLARVSTPDGVAEGEYRDGRVLTDEATYEVGSDATLLAPCEPSALYCAGRNYAAKIELIDRWIGQYLDRLDERGELEDTLVVFA
ncbi:MAG: hypothetical protein ABEJ28_02550, partial [Salinigranum sp.]